MGHRIGGVGRWVKSKAVNHGRNAELTALRDERWVKCCKCGFTNHLDRSMKAPRYSATGTGVSFGGYGVSPWSTTGWGSADPVISSGAGCSFCGSYLYAG